MSAAKANSCKERTADIERSHILYCHICIKTQFLSYICYRLFSLLVYNSNAGNGSRTRPSKYSFCSTIVNGNILDSCIPLCITRQKEILCYNILKSDTTNTTAINNAEHSILALNLYVRDNGTVTANAILESLNAGESISKIIRNIGILTAHLGRDLNHGITREIKNSVAAKISILLRSSVILTNISQELQLILDNNSVIGIIRRNNQLTILLSIEEKICIFLLCSSAASTE